MDKKYFLRIINAISPDLNIAICRRHEQRGQKDKRRQAIASQYPLTKEQKELIDDFFLSNYGEKIGYSWHQNYAAHSGKFDYKFFPELLYIPEFETFQNHDTGVVAAFADKNLLPLVAAAAKVRMPRTIVSCANGVLRDGDNNVITPKMAKELVMRQGNCFLKPTIDSCSGRGCLRIDNPTDLSITYNTLKVNDINGGYKNNFVIQELVTCHNSISELYAGSVNTFRVISYLWKGQIELMPIIIRIGQGGHYLDNAHQGGMFCAVYNDGRMGHHAMTEFNVQFTEHPDTHVRFETHRIVNIEKLIAAAKRMHSVIPQIGVVNWDFTIDAEGEPILIEANTKGGSIWLPQMAHGVGAFGDRTAEVLQWLRFMKKLSSNQRNQYSGGEMG